MPTQAQHPQRVSPYHLSPEGFAVIAAQAAKTREHLAQLRAKRAVETLMLRVRGAR